MYPNRDRRRIRRHAAATPETTCLLSNANEGHQSLELAVLRKIPGVLHIYGTPRLIQMITVTSSPTRTISRRRCKGAAGITPAGTDVLADMQSIPYHKRGKIDQRLVAFQRHRRKTE